MNSMFIRARYNSYSIIKVTKELKEQQGFYVYCHSRWVAMVWNDMQWYSYTHCHSCWCNDMQGYVLHSHTLQFLLVHTFLNGYVLNGYAWNGYEWTCVLHGYEGMYWCMFCIQIHCHSCWCRLFEWIRSQWIRIEGIRIEWIRHVWKGYVLKGYVLKA